MKASTAGLIAVLAMAGCGGGGGDSGSPSPTTTKQINSQNAEAIAAHAYAVTVTPFASGYGSAIGLKSVEPSTAFSVFDFSMRHLEELAATQFAGTSAGAQTKSVSTTTTNCTNGGTLATTTNLANGTTLQAGDTLTQVYTNCSTSGAIVSGTVATSNYSATGAQGSATRQLGVTYTYTNFVSRSASGSTLVTTINGDVTVKATYTAAQFLAKSDISGTRLSVNNGRQTTTLSNYTGSSTTDTSSLLTNYKVTGTQTEGSGAAMAITTPSTFSRNGTALPSAGYLQVMASDSSSVRLYGAGTAGGQVAIDQDGDGAYETMFTRTWDQLALD